VVTGHFGLAAGVKAQERFVPLWALMLATAWLDVIFIFTYAAGIEDIEDVPGTDGGRRSATGATRPAVRRSPASC